MLQSAKTPRCYQLCDAGGGGLGLLGHGFSCRNEGSLGLVVQQQSESFSRSKGKPLLIKITVPILANPQHPRKTMNYNEIINFFGSQVAAAHQLGVTQPTLSNWKARGRVPQLQQLRIQHITKGRLKAAPEILKVSRA